MAYFYVFFCDVCIWILRMICRVTDGLGWTQIQRKQSEKISPNSKSN